MMPLMKRLEMRSFAGFAALLSLFALVVTSQALADDKDQAALGHHNFFQALRQSEFREIGYFVGNGSDYHTDVLLLHEHIDPKARNARYRDGEIALELFSKGFALTLIHERIGEITGDRSGHFLLGKRTHGALQLHARREILGYEKIRPTRLAHGREQFNDVGFGLLFG